MFCWLNTLILKTENHMYDQIQSSHENQLWNKCYITVLISKIQVNKTKKSFVLHPSNMKYNQHNFVKLKEFTPFSG